MEYYEMTTELYNPDQEKGAWKGLEMKVYMKTSLSYLIIFTLFSVMHAK